MKPYYGPWHPPAAAAEVLRAKYAWAPMPELELELGIPGWKVRRWAWELGVRRGRVARPRHEYVKEFARRTGFDVRTVHRIFRWAGVPLLPTTSRRNFVVSTHRGDAAVKHWLKCELLSVAARRHDLPYWTLHDLLRDHRDYKRPGRWKRVPSEAIDAAVARWRRSRER